MHQIDILEDMVVILAAAVLVVVVLRRARVPTIAGFILTGVLAGPGALGLIDDTHEVEILAEVGVILLLFGIGLELSLDRIRRLWKAVVLGGGIQVSLTVAASAGIAIWYGLEPASALFLGCVIAVSSTAVVLRGLATRGELDAPHGRLAVGILVFQDLCVVPMILAVPFLAGEGGTATDALLTLGTAAGILAAVLVAAVVLVPRILSLVAATRQRELFVLTVFLICFGTAWAVSLAEISLALGAFLAGLVVAGSEFRHQAMSELVPAREILASLFFVSVGMLLDPGDVLAHLLPIVGLLAAILAGKFLLVLFTATILRLPLRVAILSAATLSQVGEFSFVLLGAATGTGLLGETLGHNLLVAIILSMLLTPLAIAFGPHLARGVTRVSWLNRRLDALPPGAEEEGIAASHVIVAGYGLAGRSLCEALAEADQPFRAVDANPDNVRAAHEAGHRAVLGDVTQGEVLEALGCNNARLLVLSINDTAATELAVRRIRGVAPHLPIIARTQYEMDRGLLQRAGATEVITAEATAGKAVVAAALGTLEA